MVPQLETITVAAAAGTQHILTSAADLDVPETQATGDNIHSQTEHAAHAHIYSSKVHPRTAVWVHENAKVILHYILHVTENIWL